MQNTRIIAQQMLIMLIYMTIGFIMAKAEFVSEQGSKGMSNLLLYIILPSAIINSFSVERTVQRTEELLISLGLGALALFIAIVVSLLIFRKQPLHNFSSAFSNVGFMGVPLISSTFGNHAVFYIAGLIALVNILQWVYGQHILSEGKSSKKGNAWKGVIKNPLLIGFVIGLLRYFTPVGFPNVLSSAITSIAACNAPVAMFILGIFLSKIELQKGLIKGWDWAASFVRLLIIPAMTLLVFMIFRQISFELRMSLLIAAAAPTGSNVVIYAQRLGNDCATATVTVCLSTILSLLSMPIIVLIANLLWT